MSVQLAERDIRALKILGGALVAMAILYLIPWGGSDRAAAPAQQSSPIAERMLERMRKVVATTGEWDARHKQARADLELREKGILQAETAAQAQAQLLQILRRAGKAQTPPVEIRATEIGQVREFSADYGEVTVAVSFDCGIEQLVNLLADLSAQPELLATSELRMGAANGREKLVPVRLAISGIVPRRLLPDKKAMAF